MPQKEPVILIRLYIVFSICKGKKPVSFIKQPYAISLFFPKEKGKRRHQRAIAFFLFILIHYRYILSWVFFLQSSNGINQYIFNFTPTINQALLCSLKHKCE